MKEMLAQLERFRQAGEQTVLATVVAPRGSTYRKPGAHMVLTGSGTVVGSVSGAAWRGPISPPQAQERVWAALNDPLVLQRATPGCKSLTQVGPSEHEAELEMGVAHIKGKYKGKIVIADAEPPSTYRLQIEGKGAPGFVSASVRINLRSEESGTHLTYAGEAQVGGLIAGVGQRIRGGVAKLTLEQFFKGIERGAG